MKSVRFWRGQVKQLSLGERIFYRDTIMTLLQWHAVEKEFFELDIIRRVLESEIRICNPELETRKAHITPPPGSFQSLLLNRIETNL